MQQFSILKFSHETKLPTYSVMTCTSLKIIDFSHTLVQICELSKIANADEWTKDNAVLKEEVSAANKKCEMTTLKLTSACDGKLLSACGLHFCECTTNTHEIEKMRMLGISNEYYFVRNSDNADSNNKLWRFLPS